MKGTLVEFQSRSQLKQAVFGQFVSVMLMLDKYVNELPEAILNIVIVRFKGMVMISLLVPDSLVYDAIVMILFIEYNCFMRVGLIGDPAQQALLN
ncbi:MAG: hypothetical protein JW704_06925 [Anaerolineaceae bacterium]|nr:hypothetical protein [Anaerolineaceae bacterium]MBN2676547.1 hypothetical protein [Anaerolineaceae bacterium]